jgi:hypothetical protein
MISDMQVIGQKHMNEIFSPHAMVLCAYARLPSFLRQYIDVKTHAGPWCFID